MLYFFAVQFAALHSQEELKSVIVFPSTCHDDETDENKSDWIPLILCVSDQLHFMAQSWSHYPTHIVRSHEILRVRLTPQLRVILKIREKERGIIGDLSFGPSSPHSCFASSHSHKGPSILVKWKIFATS